MDFLCFRQPDLVATGLIASRLMNSPHGFDNLWSISSCNGLFCLDFPFSPDFREFYVYNPTTNEYRLIPRFGTPLKQGEIRAVVLAFDPLKSHHYKLVCLWVAPFLKHCRFSVYSSESGLWRHSSSIHHVTDDHYLDGLVPKYGVFRNGAMHWVSNRGPFVCFDLDSECLKPMPSTPIPEDWSERNIKYYGESGDSLFLAEVYGPRATQLDLLVLERDYSKWSIKFSIDLDFLTTLYPMMLNKDYGHDDIKRYAFEIPFIVSEEEQKAELVVSLPGKIILCDSKGEIIRELVEVIPADLSFFEEYLLYDWFDSYKYIETLACV